MSSLLTCMFPMSRWSVIGSSAVGLTLGAASAGAGSPDGTPAAGPKPPVSCCNRGVTSCCMKPKSEAGICICSLAAPRANPCPSAPELPGAVHGPRRT